MTTPLKGKSLQQSIAERRAIKPAIKRAYQRDPKHAGIPRTKLKRTPKRIVEVEKPPLLVAANMLRPHALLGRVGLLPEMISREDAKGKKAGKNREDHKELAEELTEEFEALKTSIRDNGIIDPLKVVRKAGGWDIADGRNRWEASRALDETKLIPCVEISEEEARAVILAAMTRRHMSKQARALMAVKIFPEIAEAPKQGRKLPAERGVMTQSELAAKVGVGITTMEEACMFWRSIALNPKTRDERMNQVFAGVSFERVLQGETAALKKGQPQKNATPRVWTLMTRNANSMMLHWKQYEAIEDEERKLEIREKLVEAMKAAPADIQTAILAALEGSEP